MNLLVVPPPLVFIAYVFKFVKLCKQKYGTTEGETDGIKRLLDELKDDLMREVVDVLISAQPHPDIIEFA